MKLADILKDSNYKLSQFTTEEIAQLEQSIILKSTKSGEAPYTVCLVRKKEIKLTPEEAIRQLYLRVLTERLYYPLNRIQVEYGVNFGREVKRADIVVMDKDRLNTVYMLVEVKKPKLKDGKEQLRSYCHATGAPIAIWTNGDQISYYQRKDPNYFEEISGLPNASQTLADILQIKFTLEDLIANDKLLKQNKSLKTIVEEMEDEVLANAGVDVFEELFKLIFTKLYDEWYSGQGNRRKTRLLEFRNTGQTEAALKTKIQDLFDRSKKKWEGVFSEDAKISLSPSHLSVCISSLEDVKLFNSNLDVVDEAFEYLINKSSKGEKGQFFTPRYVIDMCVKMLNPQYDEYMIDTAAGSSGFPVHTIFHVWRQILEDEGLSASHLFSLEEKPPRCREYVQEQVFAIDFDEKAVRVARTLNLIAGDGETNVLHLNTLDYEMWDEVTGQEEWDDIYNAGFKRLKRQRPKGSKDYREFQFDVLMANPPFAGDIKETRIINHYDLAKKANGKWETKVGRDILFIERNLDFLKPGGRMAIVLPQGRFNNSSDKNIRDFIAERCRILAVVGLHGNTFKPHTGTKTSVLLVQKWNDDPKVGALCPRTDDYNIFFATMGKNEKTGKNNSGDKIYVIKSDGSREFLLDSHGHLIVDHDLYNHEGLTQDGIAEAFIEFAKKENFSFFKLSPSVAPFDAVKYERLMDGLEAVELNLIEVVKHNITFRFDSEFFETKYIEAEKAIKSKNIALLDSIASWITQGPNPNFLDDKNGVHCLNGRNIAGGTVAYEGSDYISESEYQNLERFQINKNDILITLKGYGSIGKIGFVSTAKKSIFSRDIGIIRLKNNIINPAYLFVFLLSKYGNLTIDRGSTGGTGQRTLTTTYLKNMYIPRFKFEDFIGEFIYKSEEILQESNLIYKQAEDLLLSELNLKDWQPSKETIAIKSYKEYFLSSGRLDAEYYQPKYDELIQKIKSYSQYTKSINDIQNFNTRGLQPIYSENGTLNVINSRHILEQHLDYENLEKTNVENWNIQEKARVYKNDILIYTTGANIGRTNVYLSEEKAIASNHVNILRLKEENQIYVGFVINSIIGRLQTEKLSAGSAQAELYPKDIDNFVIPFILGDKQKQIIDKYVMSLEQKLKSKQLLEIAKIGVEKAIETDEATAKDWINQQLENLGIDINNGGDNKN
ncbi:N-6 DNA methylase [Anabaena sp. PCC 7108]|uniref:N-6 DNA methylase n=1 Tax=Anabaena sp. PCC 7108 TaxID=163908 RepID=UPI00034836BF|nr:N-6 DNA methylase [Anabaena sp. PCC 7108]